jgi:hypothetical protein
MNETYFESEETHLARGKKRVLALKVFYGNLISYVVVIALLAVINYKYSPKIIWFCWPALGWGTGLFLRWMTLFGLPMWLGKDWEAKKIKAYMEQERQRRSMDGGR